MAIMEYMTKNGRRYRAQVYRDGMRVTGKAGFLTRKEARSWLAQAERGTEPAATNTDFLTLATAYLEDMETRRQPKTFQGKRTVFKRLLTFMGGRFVLESLTQERIGSFFRAQQQARGAKAANRDLVELKAMLNWAVRKGYCTENPFRVQEKYPEVIFVRRVPTQAEIEAVKAVASQEQLDFIEILLHTGARLSEICSLNWNDVDFQKNTITLWTRKRQAGNLEPGMLPMSQHLRSVLQARKERSDTHAVFVFCGREGKQFTKNSVRLWFPSLCKAAQVSPPFTAHGVRHWFATMLKDSGRANPFQIQSALRHKNLSTTEKYLHELSIDRSVADILDARSHE